MVHLRLNEKETNPNPHINFIVPLPADDLDQEEARQLLRALAAQVKPVMKKHGFVVNSFEEYEYNNVFAGRNWNNGETVEIVLRKRDRSFYPTYWLMGTLCHELAHIKHMNHGPQFKKLWSLLNAQVRQLQDRGYFGDGFWSSGTRLRDLARVGGADLETNDMPEYMCGGAQSRARPTATRRRRGLQGKRREVVPSLHTGAQTAKKRKAGGRVTSKYAFAGEGTTLGDAESSTGTGFGKRAASKRAREERALAIERRLRGGNSPATEAILPKTEVVEYPDSDDDEVEFVGETDTERRQALLDSEDGTDAQKRNIKDSWKSFKDEFNFETSRDSLSMPQEDDIIEISSSDEDESAADCDVPVASGSTFTSSHPSSTSWKKGKERASASSNVEKASSAKRDTLGLGRMVETEIDLRKKESLGMAPVKGGGRTLGHGKKSLTTPTWTKAEADNRPGGGGTWSCAICTLDNESGHLSCSACATPRGQRTWSESVL